MHQPLVGGTHWYRFNRRKRVEYNLEHNVVVTSKFRHKDSYLKYPK